jgi:hypothetical protein
LDRRFRGQFLAVGDRVPQIPASNWMIRWPELPCATKIIKALAVGRFCGLTL